MVRIACLASVLLLGFTIGADAADLNRTVYMDLKYGRVVIEIRKDLPLSEVAHIRHLIRSGHYDGMMFLNVVEGVVAEGSGGEFFIRLGDPGSGKGGGKNVGEDWGRIVDGWEHVVRIKAGGPTHDGRMEKPDKIIRMRMASDSSSD